MEVASEVVGEESVIGNRGSMISDSSGVAYEQEVEHHCNSEVHVDRVRLIMEIPEWEEIAIPEGFGPYRLLYNPPSETVIAELRSIGDQFFPNQYLRS